MAPAQSGGGNPALLWIGGILIVLGVLACAGVELLAFLAGQAEGVSANELGRMVGGSLVCGLGLLLVLAGPGALMVFLGRRR
jgi:hypothetical protein